MKERILKINDKEIHVVASEPLEDPSSENIYFMIQLDELGEHEIPPFTEVFIWFSNLFLHNEKLAKDINFDKVIDKEIKKILVELGDEVFEIDEHFVYYDAKGNVSNQRFIPFL